MDDDARARKLLARVIHLDEHRLDVQSLCEVTSGEEAVQCARDYQPHVVLMDINLPGISGWEAARRIKGELSAVAIVMVTASQEPGQRRQATELGVAGFLTKDRVATELVPLLSQVLCRSSGGG
ncbi:MAG: response regulator transcription factor [Dehalococcoidia bacterium]